MSDSDLGRLINLSSSLIYHYRVEGKAHQGVIERLKDWEAIGDRDELKEVIFELSSEFGVITLNSCVTQFLLFDSIA